MDITQLAACNLSESDLLIIQSSALQAVKDNLGQVVLSTNIPGMSTTFSQGISPIELLRAANYALSVLNPSVYGQPLIKEAIMWTR